MSRSISASVSEVDGAGAILATAGAGAGLATAGATLAVAGAGVGATQAGAGVRDGATIHPITRHTIIITPTGSVMPTTRAG